MRFKVGDVIRRLSFPISYRVDSILLGIHSGIDIIDVYHLYALEYNYDTGYWNTDIIDDECELVNTTADIEEEII